MSHYGKCKHGIYLGGCRECFPLPKLTKVGEELIQELVECFNEDKEMTANELADLNEWSCCAQSKQVSAMLRQQAKEIEELKERLEETRQLYLKQLAITHSDTQSHPIEPIAMRYDFDGYGYKYIDSGSGSDWKTRENGEFLYTKPFFSQKPVAMMVKIDGFDKPEFTTTCSSAALKHPNYTALYDHPPIAFAELEAGESIPLYEHSEDRDSAIYATGYWNGIQKAKEKNETLDTRSYLIGRYDGLRELSDEEIEEVAKPYCDLQNWVVDKHEFARAILRKASDK